MEDFSFAENPSEALISVIPEGFISFVWPNDFEGVVWDCIYGLVHSTTGVTVNYQVQWIHSMMEIPFVAQSLGRFKVVLQIIVPRISKVFHSSPTSRTVSRQPHELFHAFPKCLITRFRHRKCFGVPPPFRLRLLMFFRQTRGAC